MVFSMSYDHHSFDPSRRLFLSRMTKGGLAIAVFGFAACGTDSGATTTEGLTTSPSTTRAAADTTTVGSATTPSPTTTAAARSTFAWERVVTGNVSAYVLERAGEVAIVDTGNPGSAAAIAAAIEGFDLGWNNVGHVIVTHKHPDHVGSLEAVLDAATEASVYAGAGDIPAIASPRPIQAVADGDTVMDLMIIATPGHTPGHVCVLDPAGGLLVAGDALVETDGAVAGPPIQFTEDIQAADDSIRKLATFEYETILFGHGEPILSLGSDLVNDFAASV